MGQDVDLTLSIATSDYKLEVVRDFVCLGSIILDSIAVDMELNNWIDKASTMF